MARLLSVNVGLPRDINWRGQTIRTAIWKAPVQGRCRVTRLNLAGDGQGDTAGHGGLNRAVFVYQVESYHYWQDRLGRQAFAAGQFGENFTVEGMPDDQVCIGDRFQIGSAIFEVSQPRVTCYRIGIRMDEPRMPALLTASGRPGFYLRVLQEGEVGAGDDIVKVAESGERMSVTEINALLYLPPHAPERLRRAVQIAALSPGWQASLAALLQNPASGNAGLVPDAAAHPSAPGFRPLVVTQLKHESCDVLSVTLQSADAQPLPAALPGQYVVIRLPPRPDAPTLLRSYSLSGPPSTQSYRIGVKLEPGGRAGAYLRTQLKAGDSLEVSSPHGSFILQPAARPLVLLSAGIGVTPVLAMLHALSAQRSTRPVLWLHSARDGAHHPFASEVDRLLHPLGSARRYICYSQPRGLDIRGKDFDAAGHFSRSMLDTLGISREAEVYLCGPTRFMNEMTQILAALEVATARIHTEIFGSASFVHPGVVGSSSRSPHVPDPDVPGGPLVSFARSNVAAHWKPDAYRSVLELAEACDVPVRWSCRSGVCHSCESARVSGSVRYDPAPLDAPAEGNVLICCARPTQDLVLDL